MDFKALIPMVLTALASQELSFATSELSTLFTNENARIKGGMTSAEIDATVNGLVKLAFAEQNALVAMLTAKTAPSKAA